MKQRSLTKCSHEFNIVLAKNGQKIIVEKNGIDHLILLCKKCNFHKLKSTGKYSIIKTFP